MSASNGKDTIYVDIDDEITAVIDKVRSSGEKIVALVLPKRATIFQSIVNMKLLKRSADEAKKHIVLITTESGLLPLAAAANIYVAKNLQTKPAIPVVDEDDSYDDLTDQTSEEEADTEEVTAENAGKKSVGELSKKSAASSVVASRDNDDDEVETVELNDDEPVEESELAAEAATAEVAKKPKNKKLRIPNFNKFRLRLALGVLVIILLIVGWIFAVKVLPSAAITVSTNTSSLSSSLALTLDTKAKTLDPDNLTVPATLEQISNDSSQQVPTTGQKNEGKQAVGTVTLTNCTDDGSQVTVPAGTGISVKGLTYITQASVTLTTSTPGCKSFSGFTSGDVKVVAQTGGSNYNVEADSDFSVAGFPDVSATNDDAFKGGTDNMVKVVSQTDIDSATKKITAQNNTQMKQQLQQKIQQASLFAITATFAAGTPKVTTDTPVGGQADNVTVTETINYTMFAVKKDDLKTLVINDVKDQIDPKQQSILSAGLDSAEFRITSPSDTSEQIHMDTVATAGPDLDADTIKKEIAGKKTGDVESMLQDIPGVTSVKVNLSPFWVETVPKNSSKVTVTFDKHATGSKRSESDANQTP